MTRRLLAALLILLALLGITDSWYLASHAATDTALVCDIGAGLDGCNTVAQSPYSQFMGIPLAYFGVAFYTVLLILGALAFCFSPRRLLYKGIFALSVASALASVCFLFIQFFLIQAVCVYCIVSAVLAFLSVPLSYLLLKRFAPQLPVVIP
ncbi:MAG TPA: vitamin K epoxide reductase family protein [Candidatus Paceibacterota bacterium]|nr:vitamin K epoxide reductase family protein [Candidatus Paceibacterota bacterium]